MDEKRQPESPSAMITALYDRPGFLLRRCVQETGFAFEQGCAELGLTARQYDFLFALQDGDPMDQDQLARILGLDRSTTGTVLRILERKKLVAREVSGVDRRKRSVILTTAGDEIFHAAESAALASRARALNPLEPEERQIFLSMLRRIVEGETAADR
jgi:DNA-binding MarR family transcriptional regulator